MLKPDIYYLKRSYLENISDNFFDEKFMKIYNLSKCYNIPALELDTALFLRGMVVAKKPYKILELGCGAGASTYMLNYNSNVKIDAVDSNKIRIELVKKNFENEKNISFYHLLAEEFIADCTEKYDFVFIDTIKKGYEKIWHMLQKNLSESATVVFDDFLFYGYLFYDDCEIPEKYISGVRSLKDFYHEIKNSCKEYQLLPIGNGVLIVNKGFKDEI